MDKNLIQRLITGTIFVVVLVGAIMWSMWSMALLFATITVLGILEFYKLAEKAGARPQKFMGVLLGLSIFAFSFLVSAEIRVFFLHRERFIGLAFGALAFLIPFVLFFIELFRKTDTAFTNIGYTLLGCLYVAVPFSLWNFATISSSHNEQLVYETHYHWHLLLGFFILMWTSDSMAYVCGRLFGKHKLFERISPKKTWEGFIGGTVFAIGAGYLLSFFYRELSPVQWMFTAGVVAVTGMLGDLVESMFKRNIGVKDSGNILPGHGGILDRFDAALLASPFVVACLFLFS
jgi:phosphatidate cytidylyltransferase